MVTIIHLLACAALMFPIGSRAALADTPKPFRPVLFIPGILGTQLLDESGNVVWGGASSLWNFSKLEMIAGRSRVQLLPGKPIQEISMLGPFWTIHQYDQLTATFTQSGLKEGQNLFVFGYDWRRSNYDTLTDLQKFVHANLKDRDFDIVAHSMGGIIARLYLLNDRNATRVKRLITLATPARGSMNSIAELSEGWGGLENRIAGGIELIRTVAFSFPSLFELFPSYENCCRLGTPTRYKAFDPTDYSNWEQFGWIPAPHRTPERLAAVKSALLTARRLRVELAKPLPNTVELTMVAGDRIATKLYWYVDPAKPAVSNWRFSQSLGDGTVPLWSAAASNWPGKALPAFVDHATIFADEWVTNFLKRQLNSSGGPPPIKVNTQTVTVTGTGRFVEVSLVRAQLDSVAVAAGAASTLDIVLNLGDAVQRGELSPIVTLAGPDGTSTAPAVTEITTGEDLSARVLRYRSTIQTTQPGVYVAQIGLPGVMGRYHQHILAYGN